MTIAAFKKFVEDNKLLLGLAAIPLAAFAVRKIHEAANRVEIIGGAMPSEPRPKRRMSMVRKNELLKAVFDRIKEIEPDMFLYRFAQSKKRGYRGYYIVGKNGNWVFLCWSDEFQAAHGQSPFWIELDEAATKAFREGNLKQNMDIYQHPEEQGRIVVSITREDMSSPNAVAEMVLDIARKTLQPV